MDREKIEQIRKELSIPLTYAIKLLKENQNDIPAAIINFHKDNIEKLVEMTECEPILAQTQYQAFACNLEKALSSIHSIQQEPSTVIFTTGVNKQKISGEIGIFVWKEPKPIDQREQRAFIPLDDFKHLLDIFNGVFPLENPIYTEDQSFDICGHNFIDCLACQIIIKKIKEIETYDQPLKDFLQEVVTWLEQLLEDTEHLVFYGNL